MSHPNLELQDVQSSRKSNKLLLCSGCEGGSGRWIDAGGGRRPAGPAPHAAGLKPVSSINTKTNL